MRVGAVNANKVTETEAQVAKATGVGTVGAKLAAEIETHPPAITGFPPTVSEVAETDAL